jgi:hypothetical protein
MFRFHGFPASHAQGLALSRRCTPQAYPVTEQEWAVELLDIDPAILNWLECVCVLQQTAGCFFRIGEWAVGC